MPARTRMFILAAEATLDRLRREAGSPALADAEEVVALPLDRLAVGSDVELPEQLAELFELAAARGRRPAVAVCEVEREGDVARFTDQLQRLASVLRGRLQRDRMPFPLQAVVIVGQNAVGPRDLECLRVLSGATRGGGSPAGSDLEELLPSQLPVYLMLGRTRLDHTSRSWRCSEVWPVAVARLLASVEAEPSRTGGLRSWRSFATSLGGEDAIGLEREVLEIVRSSIGGLSREVADADAASLVRALREEVTPEDPPSDTVSSSSSPKHRLDRFGRGVEPHPPVPAFWELDPAIPDSPEPTGGSVRHTLERLDNDPDSRWHERRSERGKVFIHDRRLRVVQSIFTFSGPRSILRRVWQRIHRHPGHLPWHAEGGFIRLGDRRELSIVADQSRAWQEIEALDREVVETRAVAEQMAAELDRARSRFVGIPWRVAAVLCSALFSAAIVGTVTAPFPPKWTLYTGVATAVSAALAGLLIIVTELVAARRGRDLLETANTAAEAALSRAFQARLKLGCDGEILQRSMAWLQSAARVRETARRLLELQSSALERTLVARHFGTAAGRESPRAFERITTIDTNIGINQAGLAAQLRRADPEFVQELDASFQRWWSDALRTTDAGEVGSIDAGRFRPVLERELRNARLQARLRMLQLIEERESKPWLVELADGLARVAGHGTDFAGLSVQTERARGRRLRRATLSIGSSDDLRECMARVLEASALDGFVVSRKPVELSHWGYSAIVIDEISIEVEPHEDKSGLRFHEGLSA
jgi:hypothetical protein